MQNKKCPCVKCESREIGCHGKCEKYISWKTQRQQEQDKIHEIREQQYKDDMYIAEAKKRMSRAKRGTGGRA